MKALKFTFLIFIFYCNNYAQGRESISVKAGWNFIGSLSTGPITSAISTTPSNIINSPFYKFNNYQKNYEAVTILEAGGNYWVNFTQNGTLYFNGPKPSSIDTVNVYRGWNSFGSISTGSISVLIHTSPSGILSSSFYKYDVLTGLLITSNDLLRGSGYWVNVNQNGKLLIQTTDYGQQNDDTSQVKLTFSEPMSRIGIFDVNNYLVLRDLVIPLQVYRVGVTQDDSTIVLFTEKYSPTSSYKVIVNNLRDRAGNLINREFNFAFY